MASLPVIHHFQFEIERWLRLLSFFRQENVYFKTRLSALLGEARNQNLEEAEAMQVNFIRQDEIIHFFEDELKQQMSLLEREKVQDGRIFPQVVRNQRRLRKDLFLEEELFHHMEQS